MIAADLALYQAKDAGRDCVVLHVPPASENAERHARAAWSQRIREGLENERFVAYRQPIMTVADRSVSRFELLVRLVTPDGSTTPPGAFLPTAERTSLIREIDRVMVSRAVELIASVPDTAFEVNLSARSVADPALPAFVSEQLRESAVDPSLLVFEITETAAIANMEQACDFARAMRELGCGFALDDFGAGFASFYYLKHLPLDWIKIDGDFIVNLTQNRIDQLVVRHMVEMAQSLGLGTIAEFVTDEETVEMLAGYGVDCVQGYFIGRPEPAEAPFPAAA